LWDTEDAGAAPTTIEDGLGRVMRQWASGIEFLGDAGPHHVRPYRARPWDGDEYKHIHVGYYATWEEALMAVRLWHAACGTTDDDSLNCAKWSLSPWWMRRAVTMTLKDIEEAARDDVARPGRGVVRGSKRWSAETDRA